ncbi:MAG: TatD family hydrolase [Candidatus Hermodarchaeota archaeon]
MLVDVHCHCNLYLAIENIVKEAKESGVDKIICVGMSALGLERVLEISKQFDEIFPALGIHPEEVKLNRNIESQLNSISELIRNNKDQICAIGEIGLDHYFIKDKELYPLQKTIFDEMLSIAQELELPVNLHTKGAEELIFDTLTNFNLPNINIHWYSGPETYLKEGIDRGYYFSITPAIKYSPAIKKVVLEVGLDHLLTESDGPVEYSGEIGTPAMVNDVIVQISTLKNIPRDELESQILENTRTIFPRIF